MAKAYIPEIGTVIDDAMRALEKENKRLKNILPKNFAEQEGKRGGEFFTPSCVVRTLVEILKPFKGRVYDMIFSKMIQFNATYILKSA